MENASSLSQSSLVVSGSWFATMELGVDVTCATLLRFSLGLARTAYLPVMTTARIALLVMDYYLEALYHMYDSDSFLGSLY